MLHMLIIDEADFKMLDRMAADNSGIAEMLVGAEKYNDLLPCCMNYDVMDEAIGTWGEHWQLLQLCEEMNELAVEIHHKLRKKDNFEDLVEERADVQLMLGQFDRIMQVEFGKKYFKEFARTAEFKERRTQMKLIDKKLDIKKAEPASA